MNSLAFPAAFGLFALGLVLLFGGLFLGFALKESSTSADSNNFSGTDLTVTTVALGMIGLALYFVSQGDFVPSVIFALAAAFSSGILWGKTDLTTTCANGVRWF